MSRRHAGLATFATMVLWVVVLRLVYPIPASVFVRHVWNFPLVASFVLALTLGVVVLNFSTFVATSRPRLIKVALIGLVWIVAMVFSSELGQMGGLS